VPWYGWVLVWLLLLIGAVGVLFLFARSLWGKAKLLLAELTVASDRLQAATDGLQQLADTSAARPDVFTPPLQLRQERFLAGRGSGAGRVPKREPGHSPNARLRS
jgi:hypothetical protein